MPNPPNYHVLTGPTLEACVAALSQIDNAVFIAVVYHAETPNVNEPRVHLMYEIRGEGV